MFATGCSPLTGRHIGNMTLLSAGESRRRGRSPDLDWVVHPSCHLPQPDSDFLDRQHPRPLSTAQAAVACVEAWCCRCRSVGINPPG